MSTPPPMPPLHAAVLVALLMLAGCSTAPTAAPPGARPLPAAFSAVPNGFADLPAAETQPRGAWWRAFADPALNDLAERAAAHNSRIDEAVARLAQARAAVRGARAQARPQAGVSAGANRQGGPLVNAAGSSGTLLTLSAGLSWEPDLFGRLAAAGDAAALDAQAAAGVLASLQLAVQAELAQDYLALRALDGERRLLRVTLQAWRDSLRITEARQRLGAVAEPAVARAQAELAQAEADAAALDRRRTELEHALASLVGEAASGFALAEVDAPSVLPQIPAGIPSDVLVRRSDVSAAQQRLLAAQARAGAARAAWFPSLNLTASGGQASPELATLLSGAMRAWGVGALLSLPLLDGGRREAVQAQAQADVELALAQHRGQVLAVFKEVEDQLTGLRALAEQSQAQQRAVSAAQRSAELMASRERNGLASRLELLDARRNTLQAQRQWLQVEAARRQATVALIRALGGAWDAATAAGPAAELQASPPLSRVAS